MLSGTGQSGTRDPGPGTHRVPENIAIQSGTRDLGTQVPESIVVPLLLVRLVIKLPLFHSSRRQKFGGGFILSFLPGAALRHSLGAIGFF